ncbi:Major facilitator superfamily domain general substrate transporter [Penicillium canariense]|uniref:Major facilitator superfamily domain general substrate transporter n=1 Tax=Penicillium canariense TaxID=189055 RepID=A0A9W9LUL5_9EURO|nr:Major facilitator superfamily domain general substrate transporter [Penicillium canariense]KAJ5176705.1 Major facilitator superfamily domain general substrate transporter [Penicillium canariense]
MAGLQSGNVDCDSHLKKAGRSLILRSRVSFENFLFPYHVLGRFGCSWSRERSTFFGTWQRPLCLELRQIISIQWWLGLRTLHLRSENTTIEIVIGGLGYQKLWDWPIIVVIGYGFSGLCVTAVPTVAVAYTVDTYKSISAEMRSS